ncbi:DUF4145 domain-containing protein [Latilactobacillus sakei]|uniref:DUF4145 domain-containing protein n=1 Tax=Latilactobacillus sakei TaxID=1599 RepID=UPI0038880979
MTNLLSRENQAPQPLFLCPNCSYLTAHEVKSYRLTYNKTKNESTRLFECSCLSCNKMSYILEKYVEVYYVTDGLIDSMDFNYKDKQIRVYPHSPSDDTLTWQDKYARTNSDQFEYEYLTIYQDTLITFQKVVDPESAINVPTPNPDICDDAKELYLEAAKVITYSPRSATALLRVTLETMLNKDLNLTGSIYKMIGTLYSAGIPEQLEIGLHFARIAGNAADHPKPGMIQLNGIDGQKTALELFNIINFLADDQISRKKRLLSLSDSFSQSDLDSIEKLREKNQKSQ